MIKEVSDSLCLKQWINKLQKRDKSEKANVDRKKTVNIIFTKDRLMFNKTRDMGVISIIGKILISQ